MEILTRDQTREWDRLTIEGGIPAQTLMENAGKAVFKIIQNLSLPKGPVAVFCGTGNNGGDGKIVARLLKEAGLPVAENANWLPGTKPAWVVDALFGTGLNRPISGPLAALIRKINSWNVPVVSVDIPSGLNADSGFPMGSAIVATHTVTFGRPKLGFYQGRGPEFCGQLHMVDIGLSPKALTQINPQNFLITPDLFESLFQPRPALSHKGTWGHVFVVAGSQGKLGAAVMATAASLKAGAGKATLILPRGAFVRFNPKYPEIMVELVGKPGDWFFCLKHLDPPVGATHASPLRGILQHASVVALGPGLGREKDTIRFVHKFIEKYQGPLVIDADGLFAVAQKKAILHRVGAAPRGRPGQARGPAPTLLTPHIGEMATLIGKSTTFVQKNRVQVARDFAQKNNCTVLLKGYHSVVACPDGRVFINPTGGPAMGSAGQGDVLTGIYAGLMSQFPDRFEEVALFGCYLHGLVGDLLAKQGQRVVMATDIMNYLHLGYQALK